MRKNLGGRLVNRVIAMSLAAVLTVGTISSSVHAAEAPATVEAAPEPAVAASEVNSDDVKEALSDAIEEEVEAALTGGAGLIVATNPKEANALLSIVGNERSAIGDELDALDSIEDAEDIIEDAEEQINDSGALDTVDEETQKAEDAQTAAEEDQKKAEDAQAAAEAAAAKALAEEAAAKAAGAGNAQELATAGAATAAADKAAGEAADAATDAQSQEDAAKAAYETAKTEYEAAKAIADDAMTAALAKVAEGAEDAEEAVTHATEAYNKAQLLKAKYDEATKEAKEDWESKAEELDAAQDDLTNKITALNKADAERKQAAAAAKAAKEAVDQAIKLADQKEDNLDDAKDALEDAKDALAAAEQAVRDALADILEKDGDVKDAKDALKAAQAALKTANELVAAKEQAIADMEDQNDIDYAQQVSDLADRISAAAPGSPEYEAADKEMNELVLSHTLGTTPSSFVWKTTTGGEKYCEVTVGGATQYYVYKNNSGTIEFYELNIVTNETWNAVDGNGNAAEVQTSLDGNGNVVYDSVVIGGQTYTVRSNTTTTYSYTKANGTVITNLTYHSPKNGNPAFYTAPGVPGHIPESAVTVVSNTDYYYTKTVNVSVTTYSYIDYRGRTVYVDESQVWYWYGRPYVGYATPVNISTESVPVSTNVSLTNFATTTTTNYDYDASTTYTTSNTASYVQLVDRYDAAVSEKDQAVVVAQTKKTEKDAAQTDLNNKEAALKQACQEYFDAFGEYNEVLYGTNWKKLYDNVKKAEKEYNDALKVLDQKKQAKKAADQAKVAAETKVKNAEKAVDVAYDKIYGVTVDRRGIHFTGLYYQEKELKFAYDSAKKRSAYAAKLVEETKEAKEAAEAASDLFDRLVLEGAKAEELAAAAAKVEAAYVAWMAAVDASDAADDAAEAAQAAYQAALAAYTYLRNNQEVIDGDGVDEASIVRTPATAPAQLPTVQAATINEAPVALAAEPTTTRRVRTTATTTEEATVIEEEETPAAVEPATEEVVEEEAAVDADTTEIVDEDTALASTMQENGFAWWWILIAIAIVTGGGFAGYRYYKNKKVIED